MKIVLIVLCLFCILYLSATIINIPTDESTIQAGIDVSVNTDTVLVQPGTYYENINYNGKNVTVASLFLTTQDTSYISQTIIDGSYNGSVVYFVNEEDTTAVLTGFTIVHGQGNTIGGGIFFDYASATIENTIITSNTASSGGGIGILSAFYISYIILKNVLISDNTATMYGGGIRSHYANIKLENVTISNNEATDAGGGIFCSDTNLNFSYENRSSIYLNNVTDYRGLGADLYVSGGDSMDVILETFTVINPTDYYTSPLDIFNFDILNSIQDSLVNCDLFVAEYGSNSNSGLSSNEPLKTIMYALSKIYADSLNPHTIYLLPGTFSPITNGESFPINCSSYVSIEGVQGGEIILDANNSNSVMNFSYVNNLTVKNLTIQNGSPRGVTCYNSNPNLENLNINNNSSNYDSGGFRCSNSSPNFLNVTISGNSATTFGGGLYCSGYSNPTLMNVSITDNTAGEKGGGIYCTTYSNPVLINVLIRGNSAGEGGAIYCNNHSSPIATNVILDDNTSEFGGAIYCYESYPIIINSTITNNTASIHGGAVYSHYSWIKYMNCIFWNNTPQEIYFSENGYLNYTTVTYSDIQGGEAGIVTNNNGHVYWLDGNINMDPLFINPISNYHLQDNSPCIGSGIDEILFYNTVYYSPEFDYDNNLRPSPIGSIPDMGAYENPLGESVNICNNIFQSNHLPINNYPNPFNPITTIEFSIQHDSNVELTIYNIKSQKIKSLLNEQKEAGKHSIIWDGKDASGKQVSSGVYLYKLKINDKTEIIKKCMLLK